MVHEVAEVEAFTRLRRLTVFDWLTNFKTLKRKREEKRKIRVKQNNKDEVKNDSF